MPRFPLGIASSVLPRVRRRAFTVIELLIVVSIIITLAVLLVMVWPMVQERIVRLHCMTNLSKCQKIMTEYGANNGGYLPPFTGSGTNTWNYIYNGCTKNGNTINYVLVELKTYGASADIFLCPAWPDYDDENHPYRTYWETCEGYGNRAAGYNLWVGFWPWVTGNNWQWHPWLLPNARQKAMRVDSPGNPPIMSDEMNYDPGSWTGYTWNGFYHRTDRDKYPDAPGGGGHSVFLNGAVDWYTWEELLAESQATDHTPALPFYPHNTFTRKGFAGWKPRDDQMSE